MKNILTVCLLLSIAIFSQAQTLPNFNLETWEIFNEGGFNEYEEPENWHTPNPFTVQGGGTCVSMSEDAFSGSYAARLETVDLLGGLIQAPGLLTLADFDVNITTGEYSFAGGYYLREHVTSLSGMYKYSGADGDSAAVIIYNFRHPEGEELDTIGIGEAFLHDAADWTPFEVNMEFNNDHLPDTFNVIILSSGSDNLNAGSVLYIDSVSIETITGTFDFSKPLSSLHTFPNPAIENINFETTESGSNRTLLLYDILGKQVMEMPFNDISIQVDIQHLYPGVFSYILTENGKRTHSGSFLKKISVKSF